MHTFLLDHFLFTGAMLWVPFLAPMFMLSEEAKGVCTVVKNFCVQKLWSFFRELQNSECIFKINLYVKFIL